MRLLRDQNGVTQVVSCAVYRVKLDVYEIELTGEGCADEDSTACCEKQRRFGSVVWRIGGYNDGASQ